jgi:hypothetical protein
MNKDLLRQNLKEAGLSDEAIEAALTKSEAPEQELGDALEGDNLLKAVDSIAEQLLKAMDYKDDKGDYKNKMSAKDDDDEESEEDSEESEEDEDDEEEDMARSDAEYVDVTGILEKFASKADEMVTQTGTAMEDINKSSTVLQKGILAMGQVLQKMDERMKHQDVLMKSIVEALNLPVPPRTVTGDAVPVPAPAEALKKSKSSYDEVMQKAGAVLRDPNVTQERQSEVLAAVAHLESGVSPDQVTARFNLQ